MPDIATAPASTKRETGPQPNQNEGVEAQLPKALVFRLATYMIGLSLVLIYFLIKIWPGTLPLATMSSVAFGFGKRLRVDLYIETRYLLIAAVSGAIGSYIHLATSFADFVGNNKLKPSWELWYVLRPFIGATLAIVVYFVLRAGLISDSASAGQLSAYGVAAISGMCGLFSKQATDKLQAIFEEAFRTKERVKRADPLTEGAEATHKS
jgi:hypothetical protein